MYWLRVEPTETLWSRVVDCLARTVDHDPNGSFGPMFIRCRPVINCRCDVSLLRVFIIGVVMFVIEPKVVARPRRFSLGNGLCILRSCCRKWMGTDCETVT